VSIDAECTVEGNLAHATSLTADAETLAMMAFAALMTILLFRKFSTAKISSQLRAAHERERAQARFGTLIRSSSDVLILVDATFTITYVTPSFERTLGWSNDEVIGRSLPELIDTEDQVRLLEHLDAQPGARLTSATLRWRHKEGSVRYLESVQTNLLNAPDIGALVINARDVTERHRLETELLHSAFHDALTKIPNRVLFTERLTSALRRHSNGDAEVAILFVDLDDFKTINDTLGHAVGDELLQAVADRLQGNLPEGETVARLAGDEFAILLETKDHAQRYREIALELLEVLHQPYHLTDTSCTVLASIGGAKSSDQACTTEELLKHADVAMYVAKKDQLSSFAAFDEKMQEEILDRLSLKSDLKVGIERDELTVYYQPVIDLTTEQIVGVEALVRWIHPARGFLSPLTFIPIAEESGLIVPLGRFVQLTACTQMARWNMRYPERPLTLNVNLSVRELQEPGLVQQVAWVLEQSGLDPTLLTLELTETVVMSQLDTLTNKLHRLHDLGVRIAIDDFGTGYSSLSYLESLPVDALKIDKSFTDHLLSGDPPVTLKTIVQLGNDLHLKLVAEGIEEASQASSLVDLGCALGQGFHFARPLTAHDLEAEFLSNKILLKTQRFRPHPVPEDLSQRSIPNSPQGSS
jgi:diguanylate cyclase (GGDEF)-like protein/PAS domain S-box-containing protein